LPLGSLRHGARWTPLGGFPSVSLSLDQGTSLTDENAEEFRDWAYDAFMQWGKILDRARKEALVEAACQADEICPQQRWAD